MESVSASASANGCQFTREKGNLCTWKMLCEVSHSHAHTHTHTPHPNISYTTYATQNAKNRNLEICWVCTFRRAQHLQCIHRTFHLSFVRCALSLVTPPQTCVLHLVYCSFSTLIVSTVSGQAHVSLAAAAATVN